MSTMWIHCCVYIYVAAVHTKKREAHWLLVRIIHCNTMDIHIRCGHRNAPSCVNTIVLAVGVRRGVRGDVHDAGTLCVHRIHRIHIRWTHAFKYEYDERICIRCVAAVLNTSPQLRGAPWSDTHEMHTLLQIPCCKNIAAVRPRMWIHCFSSV